MGEFRAKLVDKIERTACVVSFRFSPAPDYQPGQFTRLILDEEEPSKRDLNKYLSFSSAPGKDYFEVTKKISQSAFSHALCALSLGREVLFYDPMGSCVFSPRYDKIGFLAGGVGITPVISILEYITRNNISTHACLIYSNVDAENIAFKPELDEFAAGNHNIEIMHILSQTALDSSGFYRGRIDKNFIIEHMPDYKQRHFFIFGPPAMVASMQNVCLELGCNKDNIKVENFIGY